VIVGNACTLGRFEETMWGREASVGRVEVEPLTKAPQKDKDIRTAQVKQVLLSTIALCSRFDSRLDVIVFSVACKATGTDCSKGYNVAFIKLKYLGTVSTAELVSVLHRAWSQQRMPAMPAARYGHSARPKPHSVGARSFQRQITSETIITK
jgi:hypothetical protein